MARPRRRTGVAGEELEAAFAVKVENLLTLYGWRWYHTYRSDRSVAGFPDYVALRGPELIVAELKTERGRVSAAQTEWLDAWRKFGTAVNELIPANWRELGGAVQQPGVDVYLWRPSDLDAINERLSHGRHRLEFA